jgi:hypothetical protein
MMPSWAEDVRRQFLNPEHGAELWKGLAMAMLYAVISAWLGLALGRWMKRIQR